MRVCSVLSFLILLVAVDGRAQAKPSTTTVAKPSLNNNNNNGKPFVNNAATAFPPQVTSTPTTDATSTGAAATTDVPPTPPPPPPHSLADKDKQEQKVSQALQFKRRPAADYGLRYSSNDWFINIISTPTSFILRRIRKQLLTQAAVACAVIYFYPKHPGLAIPMTGHSLLAASLGLLMSYRTNSAYARFWEARGHWTKAKATCRNLALMVKAYSIPHSPIAATHFLQLLAAFPSALMYLCLGGRIRMTDNVQRFLPLNRTEEYQEFPALPAMDLCLQMHQTIHAMVMESKTARADDLVEAAHLNEISHLVDVLMEQTSCCEKILRTPVPWTYSRHTSRFLTLWITTLPFALIGTLPKKWLTLAVTMAASYCMLGIEEIGHLIEQPFLGDPLDGEVWGLVDKDGEASPLIKRGLTTQPYDIGIPVCSLAVQIREEVERIANMEDVHAAPSKNGRNNGKH